MKTLKKGNTINKTDLGENSIELFTGDDVISSYDLNRPIKNIFDNQVEEKIFRETLLKGIYGKQVGIFENVLEEFKSNKVFASYNGETYFRVPSGALVDKLSPDYIQDDFYSYGFVNKPNLGLMERQLASLINLDLTEDGNELSIEYDSKNKSYTINTSIDYVTGIQKTSLPAPADYAKGILSFDGVVSSASGLQITTYLDGESYKTTVLPTGKTAEDACTAVYDSLNVSAVTTNFTLKKATNTSISITYNTKGNIGNSINCSITKSASIDSLIVSGPIGYLSGGMDYKPITNVFEVFDAFRTAYSGYNISSKGLEYKLNLEPLFNITNITIDTLYYLYFNRSQEKNFVNLSSDVFSCTDASGNFGLSTTPPENSFVIGTVIKNLDSSLSYIRDSSVTLLSEDTIYPKNINANKIQAEEFVSTGSFGLAQTNFVNKMSVTSRAEGYTKIATFIPRQSFGTITVFVKSDIAAGKNGSFSIEINSGEQNKPSITVKGMVYGKTVDYIKVEVSFDYTTGNIWLRHGNFKHNLEMNLTNSLNVTLLGGDKVSTIPTISPAYTFERYLVSAVNANTTDSYQFNITNNEINIINPKTSLKAQSDKNLLKVGDTGISQSVSYKIGEINKTAEVKLAGDSPIPLFTLKGANVEISNFDADDLSNNRYIKLYTGPVKPTESPDQEDPTAVGPSIMLDKNTVDISGDDIHIWGGTFTVHGNNINFGSTKINGKLFVSDTTAASFNGTAYSTKINGGLYTGGNIIANTTIEAKGNIKGLTINSLTISQESVGFKISGGSSTRKTGTFMSNFTVGTTGKLGDITISSNNGTARTIELGGDLTVSSGKFTLSGNASGTSLNIVNNSLSFLASLSKTGALLYTSTANTVESLTAVASGSVLLSGTAAPSWGKLPLTTHVNGILPLANGGTGSQGSTTNRAIPYISGGNFNYTGAGTNNSLLGINSSGAVEWISNNDLTVSKADKLSSNKTISFTGDVTGKLTTNFESSSVQCTLTVADDSHNHSYYAPKDSPAFTGTPTAPTQAAGNSSTRLATTAFVQARVAAIPTAPIRTPSQNTAVGNAALYRNTTGDYNTALGRVALYYNTTGSYNTAIGYESLYRNTTGSSNVAIGYLSLNNSTGSSNTAVGTSAGQFATTGSNNTFIGNGAYPSKRDTSNQITLGNGAVTSLRCAVTTITAISDRRDKKNIEKLEIGLDFVKALNPCGWNYDLRENYPDGKADGSKMKKERNHGFIAQDLQELQEKFKIDLGLVMDDNPDKLETSEGRLLPVMVKAIQELADRFEKLEGVK